MVRQETKVRIISLHRSGVPSSSIARRLGIRRSDVNHVIKDSILKGQQRAGVRVV